MIVWQENTSKSAAQAVWRNLKNIFYLCGAVKFLFAEMELRLPSSVLSNTEIKYQFQGLFFEQISDGLVAKETFLHIVFINHTTTPFPPLPHTLPSRPSPRGHRRLHQCVKDGPEAGRTADSKLHRAWSGASVFFLGYPQQRGE